MNYINAKKYCNIRFTLSFNWKELLKPVLIIFSSNVAIQIYVNSDMTMLGYMKSDYEVGIYSVATKIYSMVKSMLGSVLIVTIPRLSYLATKNLKDDYETLMRKVANSLIILIVPAVVGLVVLSENAVLIVSSEKYLLSSVPLKILSVAIIFSVFSGLFNNCVLLPYKREKVFLRSSIVSATTNIVLNVLLIPFIGVIGAAITTLISEFIMAFMNYKGCRDIIRNVVFDINWLKNILSVIVGSVGIVMVCYIVELIGFNKYFESLITVVLSCFVYVLILFITKNQIFWDVCKSIAIKSRKKVSGQ